MTRRADNSVFRVCIQGAVYIIAAKLKGAQLAYLAFRWLACPTSLCLSMGHKCVSGLAYTRQANFYLGQTVVG